MMERGFILPDGTYTQAIEVRDEQHFQEILSELPEGSYEVGLKPIGDFEWGGTGWVEFTPEPVEVVKVLFPVDLWSRLTDEEAEMVEAAISQQPIRLQNIFRAASSYRSDHELWGMLTLITETLFGEARAKELLKGSYNEN